MYRNFLTSLVLVSSAEGDQLWVPPLVSEYNLIWRLFFVV